jgi:hypothetical protein
MEIALQLAGLILCGLDALAYSTKSPTCEALHCSRTGEAVLNADLGESEWHQLVNCHRLLLGLWRWPAKGGARRLVAPPTAENAKRSRREAQRIRPRRSWGAHSDAPCGPAMPMASGCSAEAQLIGVAPFVCPTSLPMSAIFWSSGKISEWCFAR